jgi:hypothetical protein
MTVPAPVPAIRSHDIEVKRDAPRHARRIWQEMDSFVESHSPRWIGRAGAILSSEGSRASEAYEAGGEGAAIASVDDQEWLRYLRSLWISTVPAAGAVVQPYLPSGKSLEAKITPEEALLAAATEWLRMNGLRGATQIANTSRREIAGHIDEGIALGETSHQIAMRILTSVRSRRPARSETIGHTEVHAATNYGSLSAAQQTRAQMAKFWVHMADDRVRDSHRAAGGQRRTLDDAFLVSGERLMFPGDVSMGASPGTVVRCRCHIAYGSAERMAPRRPRRVA